MIPSCSLYRSCYENVCPQDQDLPPPPDYIDLEESAPAMLVGIKLREQSAKRQCTVHNRDIDNNMTQSEIWDLYSAAPIDHTPLREQLFSGHLLKEARSMLGVAMILMNILPHNIEETRLKSADLETLKSCAPEKRLAIATREGNSVSILMLELYDKVIYKYINANPVTIYHQLQRSRFRFWSSADGEALGCVQNLSTEYPGILERKFVKVGLVDDVFTYFPERYNQYELGNLIFEAVSHSLRHLGCTLQDLTSRKRISKQVPKSITPLSIFRQMTL
jgi:hypothetical protein